MTGPACENCDRVERGPWETDPCPTTRVRRDLFLSQADLAVYVLEHARGPLSIYDIQRAIQRERGWEPQKASLTSSVATDLRCCWAGKGLYALYRHGFIPGPRRLCDVAKVILHSQGQPLQVEELAFVMGHMGYRFQKQSLLNALLRDGSVKWISRGILELNGGSPAHGGSCLLHIAPTAGGRDRVIERTRQSVSVAISEHALRMRRIHRGLGGSDPIFGDGSLPPAEIWHGRTPLPDHATRIAPDGL